MIFTQNNPILIIDPISKLLGDWSIEVNIWSIILRLVLAFIAGGLLGIERSSKQHTTGLRTTLLISLGSCSAMLISMFLNGGTDLTRLAAGVLTGIGFIGAGSIVVNSRHVVSGATSAAALFTSAILGLAFGCGLYTVGIFACILVMIILVYLSKPENKFKKQSFIYSVHIELYDGKDLVKILDYIRNKEFKIKSVNIDSAYQGSTLAVYSLNLIAKNKKNFIHSNDLIAELKELDFVHFVETL